MKQNKDKLCFDKIIRFQCLQKLKDLYFYQLTIMCLGRITGIHNIWDITDY